MTFLRAHTCTLESIDSILFRLYTLYQKLSKIIYFFSFLVCTNQNFCGIIITVVKV